MIVMNWGWVITIGIAFVPIFYRINNRIRILEDKIKELEKKI
jgi:hypothetical protein